MDLDALSAFSLVASNGGITVASRASGRPKATLSRQIMELEARLGVRLFERGSRSIHLTEEGELLHARTAGPLGEIEEAAELLREGRSHPRGRLRVNVPVLFGQLLMGRLAGEFAKSYPEVTLEVTVDDRLVDPAVDGFDVVVRINPAPDAALVGRCFARERHLIVAAPSLHRSSTSIRASDWQPVPAIVRTVGASPATWPLADDDGGVLSIRPILQLPSFLMIRDAAVTGVGAAKLPQLVVAGDLAAGRLVCWGVAAEPPTELWALHTSRRLASARVRVFLQLLAEAFPTGWLSDYSPGLPRS